MLLMLNKWREYPRSHRSNEVPFFAMEECARMSCNKEAVALLTFAPQQAKAWLYDLVDTDPTAGIILCRKHANATVVPMSWQLIDARDPAWPGPSTSSDTAIIAEIAEIAEMPEPTRPIAEPATHSVPTAESYGLASDTRHASGLTAQDGPLTPQPYAEPRAATLRAAGVLAEVGAYGEPTRAADPSLFELPLADVPAVTPHPDHR